MSPIIIWVMNQKPIARQHAGDDQAAIERVHDLAAGARLDEIAADDRGEDREAAEHQRIRDRRLRLAAGTAARRAASSRRS